MARNTRFRCSRKIYAGNRGKPAVNSTLTLFSLFETPIEKISFYLANIPIWGDYFIDFLPRGSYRAELVLRSNNSEGSAPQIENIEINGTVERDFVINPFSK